MLGILAVTAVNAVLVFGAGLLAVHGDGTPGGIYVVWTVGGLLVLCFTGLALHRWSQGRASVGIAACALPFTFVAATVCMLIQQLLGF